jgi:hypothetical protein
MLVGSVARLAAESQEGPFGALLAKLLTGQEPRTS